MTSLLTQARAITEVWLLAYLLTIPLGPRLVAWGRELPLLAIMAGMILARIPRRGVPQASARFELLFPLVLFAGSVVLSTLFSEYPGASLARSAYAPIALLLFLATQEVAVTREAYRRTLIVFGAVAGVLGLDGVYQLWAGASLFGDPLYPGGIAGSLPNPNDLGLIPILVPAALTVIALEPRAWASRLLLCGLPFALATTILSGSRNAWLGLAVSLGTFAGFSRRRTLGLAAGAAAIALFVATFALGIAGVPDRARKLLAATQDPRVAYWLVAWRMFTESPLLGKGVHTFGEFYLPYLGKIALPAQYTPDRVYIPWAHNLYLEILAEQGLVGAVGLGALLGAMAIGLGRFLRPGTPREVRTIAVGLAASLGAFLAEAVFDLTFLKDWPLLVFLLLAALIARLPGLVEGSPRPVTSQDSARR
ncbi:MAG: O-antigen ligase family protein [Candidatus Rokubacteria bacterium]|nr:O-antigen ligase family protein [Candidatus Rokubacteria bacterium]